MKKSICLSILLVFVVTMVCQAKGTMSEYKGVKLGVKMDDVHQKMGKPKTGSDTDEEYDLGDGNIMDLEYTPEKTVRTMVLYFYSHDDKVPKFEDVIGDAKVDAGTSGPQTAKFVDPNTKVSITMVRTGGDNSMTVITIRQL